MKLNIVPARTGLQWVKLGIQTFFRQPLALAGLFFMYMAAVLVLGAVPFLGPVVVMVLMPAATLGMMVATEHATQGRFPMPSVLVSAFRAGRQRARAMLVLGMIYALVLVGISLLASLLFPEGISVQAVEGTPAGAPQIQVKPGFLFAAALQL
ncbi:MAG TPA: BPSS1780 family membrane protein, partial [Ramlibacter sp.]